jgi:hypothetical protein
MLSQNSTKDDFLLIGMFTKSRIPFLFLITISLWWAFYYQSNSLLNDFGKANFEYLYLIDALIVLPIVCLLCVKNKKEALVKASVLSCLAVLIGSFIIPEKSKLVWHYLENGRYVILAVILLFELIAIATVYLAIRTALLKRVDPDIAIQTPIEKFLGSSSVAKLLTFETRMWTYAFFSTRIRREHFSGEQHFTYHQKDGAQSNLLGFILVIAIEMPLMHLLLHFVWSPFAANMVTLLSLFGLVFFLAEYRAVAKRPISIDANKLIIRYGLYHPLVIDISGIDSIEKHTSFVRRSKNVKRYNYAGSPNICINLATKIGNVERIYLGLDKPEALLSALRKNPSSLKRRNSLRTS